MPSASTWWAASAATPGRTSSTWTSATDRATSAARCCWPVVETATNADKSPCLGKAATLLGTPTRRALRLSVRTAPFHGAERGSTPLGRTSDFGFLSGRGGDVSAGTDDAESAEAIVLWFG